MNTQEKLQFLPDNLIVIRNKESYNYTYREIMYIYSDRPYTRLRLLECTSPVLLINSVQFLGDRLPDFFVQCNRALIVNLQHCLKYKNGGRTLKIEMANQEIFTVSNRRQALFLEKYFKFYTEKRF